MTEVLPVNDEESFIDYAEDIVSQLQDFWHNKAGMMGYAVMGLCAKLENLVYLDTLKEFHLPPTATVWSKRECLVHYQDVTQQLLRSFEFKVNVNWVKLFKDNEKNPRQVLNILINDGKKKNKSSAMSSSGEPPKKRGPKAKNSLQPVAAVGVVGTKDTVGLLSPRGPMIGGITEGIMGASVLVGGDDDEVAADIGGFGFDFEDDPDLIL